MKDKNYFKEFKLNKIIKNIITIILILGACTILGIMLDKLKFREASVILIFTLGVLFSAITTDGFIYGILASVLGVMFFNFFFTEPIYTLFVYEPDYILTFLVMLISSIIVSTLTSKIKRGIEESYIRERNIKLLYDLNQSLLRSRGKEGILKACEKELGKIIDRPIGIVINDDNNINKIYISSNDKEMNLFEKELQNLKMGNALDELIVINYTYKKLYCFPIKINKVTMGIMSIVCKVDQSLTENEKILVDSVLTQITFALEREELYKKSQEARLNAESEKLRGNLLRSISHDLRTPLTGIIGSASAIIDNYDDFDDKLKIDFAKNIYEDATWLSRSVENVISLTKMDEGGFKLNKELVIVDDIIEESISLVKKYSNDYKIKVTLPDDLLLINVDGLLIEKVLINLIENAMRHTPQNTIINIKSMKLDKDICFEVEDNGGGISEKDFGKIFERFYSKSSEMSRDKRGIGLGLSICKSIVEVHGGKISVYNNSLGGATFRVLIPCWEE